MDTARSALQVGILVCLGVILFGFGYFFFNGSIRGQNFYMITVEFSDAGGIDTGDDVEISGVKIGQVSPAPHGVTLDPATDKALVQLQIAKGVKIPVGSVVTVEASLLGGSSKISIVPPPLLPGSSPPQYYAPGAVIQGSEGFSIKSVAGQTGTLIDEVGKTTEKADKLLGMVTVTVSDLNTLLVNQTLKQNLLDTTQNIDQASRQAVLLTKQIHDIMNSDNIEIHDALGNTDVATDQLKEITVENKAKLDQIVDNLDNMTQTMNQLTQTTSATLNKDDVVGNISTTMSNLKDASSNLDKISEDIHGLSSDPNVQAELKTTVSNLAETTTSTKNLVARVNALVGGKVTQRGTGQAFLGNLDFIQNTRTDKFRTDADLYAPINNTDFIRFGIYDITETNQLNLQYGTSLPYNRALDARAGVYAGKVGLGLDYHLFRNNNLSFDLYDPNRFHLDIDARFKLTNEAALILGGEDLTRQGGAVVGLELRR